MRRAPAARSAFPPRHQVDGDTYAHSCFDASALYGESGRAMMLPSRAPASTAGHSLPFATCNDAPVITTPPPPARRIPSIAMFGTPAALAPHPPSCHTTDGHSDRLLRGRVHRPSRSCRVPRACCSSDDGPASAATHSPSATPTALLPQPSSTFATCPIGPRVIGNPPPGSKRPKMISAQRADDAVASRYRDSDSAESGAGCEPRLVVSLDREHGCYLC